MNLAIIHTKRYQKNVAKSAAFIYSMNILTDGKRYEKEITSPDQDKSLPSRSCGVRCLADPFSGILLSY